MKNHIREIRKQRGLTMKQLGEIVGVAESTISQYENNKREPDNETLLRIAEALETSVDTLLGAEKVEKNSLTALSDEDEQDISLKLKEALDQLMSGQEGLMFDGEPLDRETMELLETSLRNSIEFARRLTRQKAAPEEQP